MNKLTEAIRRVFTIKRVNGTTYWGYNDNEITVAEQWKAEAKKAEIKICDQCKKQFKTTKRFYAISSYVESICQNKAKFDIVENTKFYCSRPCFDKNVRRPKK